jgi:four helix bundle protein
MVRARAGGMKAKNLSEVLVYRKALEAQRAVCAFLKRPAFRKDYNLWDQLSRSSARVPALIAEGFGQSTDRQSADYYGRARGSAYESYTHLITAKDREYITEDENAKEGEKYIEITKMLTPWINYLQRSNWRQRGQPPQNAEGSDAD